MPPTGSPGTRSDRRTPQRRRRRTGGRPNAPGRRAVFAEREPAAERERESATAQRTTAQTDADSNRLGSTAAAQDSPSVVLHVRSSTPGHEHESTVREALEALSDAGVVDDVSVRVWPEKVSLRATDGERGALVERFRTFEEWASEHDRSIRPPFVVRHLDSAITRERDDVLVTPTLFVTVYDGDELAACYPCHDGERVTTVDDWLSSFESASLDSAHGDDERDRRRAFARPNDRSGGEDA